MVEKNKLYCFFCWLLLSLILKLIERYKSLITVFCNIIASQQKPQLVKVLIFTIQPVIINKQGKSIITPEISCSLWKQHTFN